MAIRSGSPLPASPSSATGASPGPRCNFSTGRSAALRHISESDVGELKRTANAFFEAPAGNRQTLFDLAAIAKARNGELFYDDFLDEEEIPDLAHASLHALMGLDPETLLS